MLFSKNKTAAAERPAEGLWQKLRAGLAKTRTGMLSGLADLFGKSGKPDQTLLDEIETRLLLADVGVDSTALIIDRLARESAANRIQSAADLLDLLHRQMVELLKPVESPLVIPAGPGPFVILVIGSNGAGKTTTIGKLACFYTQNDYSLLLAAGDTFRAAAIEQLKSWGDRINLPVISQPQGSDSAAVIFDSLHAARTRNADIVIADTAGRLHNKNNLMEELKKIRRTISKADPSLAVETLLVLDAGNGQNALTQARQFQDAVGITGIVLTKLDGTARGGIVFALANKLNIPVRFIGTGEQASDLSPFQAEAFVTALLASGS